MLAGIEGIGLITPWGNHPHRFLENYLARKTAIGKIRRFPTEQIIAQETAQIEGFEPKEFIAPKRIRKYDIFSQLSIAVTHLALRESGREIAQEELNQMGMVFSCETQSAVIAEYLDDLVRSGPNGVSPALFTLTSANASSCNAAIENGIQGPSVTVSSKFASGFLSAFTGIQMLQSAVDLCIAGSVDYLSQKVLEAYSLLGCHRQRRDSVAPGFLPGEGAVALLLTRGPGRYGKIIGAGYLTSPAKNLHWPTGWKTHLAVLKTATGEETVHRYFAASNGIPHLDELEIRATEALFGNHLPEGVNLKDLLGESSTLPLLQITAACCEPAGTRSLISVASPGGVHGALLIESSGLIHDREGRDDT
ncbi:MAG: hypothetical protein HY391_02980 [Deltaproteobacteria bacterium]|nr:hypothetical protein [Deltaproteobacteria bacterium]